MAAPEDGEDYSTSILKNLPWDDDPADLTDTNKRLQKFLRAFMAEKLKRGVQGEKLAPQPFNRAGRGGGGDDSRRGGGDSNEMTVHLPGITDRPGRPAAAAPVAPIKTLQQFCAVIGEDLEDLVRICDEDTLRSLIKEQKEAFGLDGRVLSVMGVERLVAEFKQLKQRPVR
jgi:hypothetical protein